MVITMSCPRCECNTNVMIEGVCISCAKTISETFNSLYDEKGIYKKSKLGDEINASI